MLIKLKQKNLFKANIKKFWSYIYIYIYFHAINIRVYHIRKNPLSFHLQVSKKYL